MTEERDKVGPGRYKRIVAVERVEEDDAMILRETYDDGSIAVADMAKHLYGHPMLEAVRDQPMVFARFEIEQGGGLQWPNGADISPGRFWQLHLMRAKEAMHHWDFRAWMKCHDLIIDSAAPVLGISRRQAARYSSGEKLIPRTILLACKGYDAMQAEKVKEDAA